MAGGVENRFILSSFFPGITRKKIAWINSLTRFRKPINNKSIEILEEISIPTSGDIKKKYSNIFAQEFIIFWCAFIVTYFVDIGYYYSKK